MVISILFPYLHLIINDQYGHKKLQFTRVPTIKRIFNGNPTVESYLGKLLFNNMIPVPKDVIMSLIFF